MLIEAYIPGTSPLHRARPLWKVLGLIVICTALFAGPGWPTLGLGGAAVVAGFALARLSPRHAVRALRPLIWILALLFAVQLWLSGWALAGFVVLRFAVLILAAALVTLTTRSSEFVDGLMALLAPAPAWVPKARIALAISLALRFLPMVRDLLEEIRQAQAARGLERNLIALAVPLLLRALKSADDISAAIYARSFDAAD